MPYPRRRPAPILGVGIRIHAARREPVAGLFYGRDLAYVHDAAFGHLARGGAQTLLRLLGRAGIRDGLVVDLGAGSGITARTLTDAGYEVLGVELSPDMVELARRRAPAARFVRSSLLDAELPACVAVSAIGECLNYAADPRAARERLGGLFARVHRALRPGGLFLCDVAEPGRERRVPRRTWHEGTDWLLCLEAVEQPDERLLRRRIVVFRQAAEGWRRSDELHTLRLYPRQDVLDDLVAVGFQTRLLAGYGSAARFRRGHAGILAVKPG
jgi:SAM-dependent methyltransferase